MICGVCVLLPKLDNWCASGDETPLFWNRDLGAGTTCISSSPYAQHDSYTRKINVKVLCQMTEPKFSFQGKKLTGVNFLLFMHPTLTPSRHIDRPFHPAAEMGSLNDNVELFNEATSQAGLSFPQFPKIPPEIWQMIWKFAFDNNPRTIKIIGDFDPVNRLLLSEDSRTNANFGWNNQLLLSEEFQTNTYFPKEVDGRNVVTKVKASMPGVLLVHSESRQVALKRYRRKEVYVKRDLSNPYYVFYDRSQDTLVFRRRGYLHILREITGPRF